MSMSKIMRVHTEHFNGSSEELRQLNRYLFLGWKVVSSNTYNYKNGQYTDYLLTSE